MISNIINKFLESDCYEEKKFIANYKDEKYDINLNICEYACKNNDFNLIQQVKNYYDGDLMEYYSNNKVIKLEIIKSLYSKYNSSYFINIPLNKKFFSRLLSSSPDISTYKLIVQQIDEKFSRVLISELSGQDEQKTIDFSYVFFEKIAAKF